MEYERMKLPEVLKLIPTVFGDQRGFFFESYNESVFNKYCGDQIKFVQDNHSRSAKNVLRGLHYQLPPMAQGKLVRVISGKIYDVAVDIRKGSKNFGCSVGAILSSENKHQLWVPSGFAHGFVTLSEDTEVLYKTTNFYSPEHERCISWDDKTLGIEWPQSFEPIVSDKDSHGLRFEDAEVFCA